MAQYHIKIWETPTFGIAIAGGSGFPTNAPSVESDIEALSVEAAMRQAMRATSFKRAGLISVVASDGSELRLFPNVLKDKDGRITHADTDEATREYRALGIFTKDKLN